MDEDRVNDMVDYIVSCVTTEVEQYFNDSLVDIEMLIKDGIKEAYLRGLDDRFEREDWEG